MMNNRGRKWMALLLAAVMLLGILPISAMAADEENPVEADTEFTGEVLEATELTAEKGFAISAKYKNKDGKEVADLSQEDPNNTFSLNLKVENIDQTALGAAGEEVQMSYQLENVTAVAGENDIVSWTYDETSGILVFQWKQGKKSGSFSADIAVTPAFPAENDLSGRYVLVSMKAAKKGMLVDEENSYDGRGRLRGVSITERNGGIYPDGWQNTVWTFEHVTGDWYTIHSNGGYLKLEKVSGKNGLYLTGKENAQYIKVEEFNGGYTLGAGGLYVTPQGGIPSNGYASYDNRSNNEVFSLYSEGSLINEPAAKFSGSWIIANTWAGSLLSGTGKGNVLEAAPYSISDGRYLADKDLTIWTFEWITRDWYYIHTAQGYLNIGAKDSKGLLKNQGASLSGTKQAIKVTQVSDGSYIFSAQAYSKTDNVLIVKSQNINDGFSSKVYAADVNSKMYMLGKDSFYTGNSLILNANRGNKPLSTSIIPAEVGDTVILPDYTGTKNNQRFIGWAQVSDIYTNPAGKNNCCFEVFLPGSEYTVTEENETLYAVFNERGTDVRFGFRKDGSIPTEPSNYDVKLYEGHFIVNGALKDGKWVVDTDTQKPVVGNHIDNNVTRNLAIIPSDEQIQAAMPDYDPETQYVHWYVLKYTGAVNGNKNIWKVDGVICTRDTKRVAYITNVDGIYGEDVRNMPLGFTVDGDSIAAGTGNNGTITEPERAGYEFLGWNTEKDGSGVMYQTNDTVAIEGNTNLYAQWDDTLTVKITSSLEGKEHVYSGTKVILTATRGGTYTGKVEVLWIEEDPVTGNTTEYPGGIAELDDELVYTYVITMENADHIFHIRLTPIAE